MFAFAIIFDKRFPDVCVRIGSLPCSNNQYLSGPRNIQYGRLSMIVKHNSEPILNTKHKTYVFVSIRQKLHPSKGCCAGLLTLTVGVRMINCHTASECKNRNLHDYFEKQAQSVVSQNGRSMKQQICRLIDFWDLSVAKTFFRDLAIAVIINHS